MVSSVSVQIRSTAFKLNPLFIAIASQLFFTSGASAAPTGGNVVGGSGAIEQSGLNTTITQETDRLAVDWASFNVATNERVEFVQPNESAIALNRILDMNGSQILGRIDANGQVILMNPNGVFFGADATVNVGSLVATGLAIDTSDFMNGDLLLRATEDGAGTVINRGLINAATGGNVALIGKQVTNSGLISADLGHVVLASGNAAVVTFDDQGLIGVRVDEAALEQEVGVNNSGFVEAAGGKILLTASVSEDLFSRAVNSGELGGDTQVVLHEDGSFSLGSAVDVLNTGALDVATVGGAPGEVVLAGRNVTQSGVVTADNQGGDAGGIHLLATNSVRLTGGGSLNAQGNSGSGHIVLEGDQVIGATGNPILTSGDVEVTAYLSANLPHISAQNLTINSIGTVRQASSLLIAGNTHLNLTAGADLRFNNAANDFGSVTMDTGHTSFVSLTDIGGIDLGELNLLDSIVHIQSDGAIRQLDGTSITLDASDLHLTGDSIALGQRADGSGVYMAYGWLDLNFAHSIDAVNSISSPSEFDTSLVTAKGYDGVNRINARSQALFDLPTNYGPSQFALSATLDDSGIQIGRLNANSANLASIGDVSQTGAIEVSAFILAATAGSNTTLTHQDNDFRSISLQLGHTTVVEIADANDLLVDSLNIQDSRVTLTSLGSNSMISQLAGASIDLYDSTLEVSAARVYLGDKANTPLRLHGFSDLYANYWRGARINGTSNSPEELPEFVPFFTSGDFGTSRLDAQGHGDFALNVTLNGQLNIHQLRATDAQLASIARVRQTGAIELTGTLDLTLASEADVQLIHNDNQLNRVSATTAYTSNLDLHTADSLTLADLDLGDSNVSISAGGAIVQEAGTAIRLGDTALRLDGRDVRIGRLDEGSGITLNNSFLEIFFQNEIELVDAISTGGEFDFSTIIVNGVEEENSGNEIYLSQSTPLSVKASLFDDNGDLRIDVLEAENAELITLNTITQTGKITLAGNLFLRTPAGGQITLENPANDFNSITIEAGYATYINLTDANDIALGDWDLQDASITLHSLGEDSTVAQLENTHIVGGDSTLAINAANIDLGSAGTSSITLRNIGALQANFSKSLTLNGSISLGSYSSYLNLQGTDEANTLTIGEFADIDISADFEEFSIDLKGGDDIIEIYRDFNYGFFTGVGEDRIYVANNGVGYTVEDFDPDSDEILILP
jgi:filamentous haemagglutinin family N-terminal domain